MQNLSQNELNQITKMHNQSQDDLEQIAKMRRSRSYGKMSKEKLIIALLKSKRSIAELFNNNLDDDKISGIKRIFNRLREILPKIIRKEIKKNIYEIENKENLWEQEKEDIDEYLNKLVRYLNKKEEYCHHDHDDLDYYEIRDIESLFSDVDGGDYYKPILVKNSFKEDKEDESGYRIGYKLYERRGDKDKIFIVEEFLEWIEPYLRDLINDHKTTESGE